MSAQPVRAVAYLRTSTGTSSYGLRAQRTAIQEWADREDVEVVAWHEDRGVSGAAPLDRRPALLDALTDLKAPRVGLLVVAKRDRLARDLVAAAMIESQAERAAARVVSAAGEGTNTSPDDPAGLLMRRMVDAFAEHERARIAARTREAMREKRSRGEYTGGHVPYGFRLDPDGVHLEEHPEEQATAEVARGLRASGLSLRAIGAELVARGLLTRSGRRRWNPNQVRLLLAAQRPPPFDR